MPKPNYCNLTETDKFYKQVFSTDAGQRVLEDLKMQLRFGETLFNYKASNELNAFQQGRQSAINDILFILSKEQIKE